jgi:hypothetical protein
MQSKGQGGVDLPLDASSTASKISESRMHSVSAYALNEKQLFHKVRITVDIKHTTDLPKQTTYELAELFAPTTFPKL